MAYGDVLFSWLVRSGLVSLAILLIGSGAVFLWRQPARRVRIIELVLAGCLITPWLGVIPGYPQLALTWRPAVAVNQPEAPPQPPAEPAIGPATTGVTPYPFPARNAPSAPSTKTTETPVRTFAIRPWIVVIYLVGVAIGAAWWLAGIVGLARILWTARPAPSRCRQLLAEIAAGRGDRVRLLVSRRISQPFASAWGRPVIVLPENVCGDEQPLRWCLAHEWAHIERHDFRTWLLAGLVRVLFFYQPLLWWLRRQLRLYQDFVADAQAARHAPQVEDYAQFLTVRAAAGSLHPTIVGLGMSFRRSELYRRVIMLLKNQPLESRTPRLWTVSVTLAALVLVAAVAAVSLTPRAVADEKPAAPNQSPVTVKEHVSSNTKKPAETENSEDELSRIDSMDATQQWMLVGQLLRPAEDGDSYAQLPSPIQDENVRKELTITTEQDKKLRELSAALLAQMLKLSELSQQSPTQEQFAQEQAKVIEQMKTVPNQVEKVLTAEQRRTLKSIALRQAASRLCYDPWLRKTLDVTGEQQKKFHRLLEEIGKLRHALHETVQDSLGVLSPVQQQRVPTIVDIGNPLLSENGTEVVTSDMTTVASVNIGDGEATPGTATEKAQAEQKAIAIKSERNAKDRGGKEVFTPQQLANYKNISSDTMILSVLADPRVLRFVNPSEEQQKGLRRLREDWNEKVGDLSRELAEKSLEILTPQQREKLIEDVDRLQSDQSSLDVSHSANFDVSVSSAVGVVPAAKPGGETPIIGSGNMVITSGTISIQPSDALRKPASAAKPADQTVINAASGARSGTPPAEAVKKPADATDREFKSLRVFLPIFAVDAIRYDSSGAKRLGFRFGAKELGLSSQQENELRAVFNAHDADMIKINQQIVKELETLSPEERAAKQAEMGERRAQQFKATRKRAEQLLTGEQRTKLNNIIVRKSASEGMLLIPQEREKIGLTEDQAKQLLRLLEELDAGLQEHFGRKPQLLREIAAQSLAVLSPQQREKLAVYVDATPLLVQTIVNSVRSSETSTTTTVSYAGGATDGEPAMVGKPHLLAKELGLNAEQVTKLQAVSATYSTKLQELSDEIRKLPPNERKTKLAEYEQKAQEIEKDARKEIERVLAPQQLAALKKSILDDVPADALTSSWMMKHLNASAEQERALRRLEGKKEETDKKDGQFFDETTAKYGENSLKVLTPQQREKVEEEVERLGR
jgi:beta-lactamase regulating signal transducer with metallopeptidase domain